MGSNGSWRRLPGGRTLHEHERTTELSRTNPDDHENPSESHIVRIQQCPSAFIGEHDRLKKPPGAADYDYVPMCPITYDKRREPRSSIQAGTLVRLLHNQRALKAVTVNMSGCGVLLQFDAPVDLAVGDRVDCEFALPNESGTTLPYWAEGTIVRLEGNRVAIDFRSGGWTNSKVPDQEP